MDFKTEFNSKLEIVNIYLEKYLEKETNAPKEILESMRYSLFAGGKRIRPILMMASYELFADDTDAVMPFACALEMIHTYSLIHDDLPAMDDSDLRRGRKTNHIVFGEAIAVLAGDALLNYAFETMLSNTSVTPEKTLKAASYMATCSGIGGMIGGQVIDISNENKVIDKATMRQLHEKKTGALIRSGAVCGAICGGADEAKIKLIEEYASYLGLAFQIKDDILDVEGDAVKLGKPTGSDSELCKNTYISHYGIDKAKEMLEETTFKAKLLLNTFGEKANFLLGFTDYLLKRDN